MTATMTPLVDTTAAAAALGVSPASIRRWIRSGDLRCYGPRGARQLRLVDLRRLQTERREAASARIGPRALRRVATPARP